MATYESPNGPTIRAYTRLQGAAYGLSDADLETALAATVAQGEDRVFARIGESYETDSTLTARQVRNLQGAVACRTGALWMWEQVVRVSGGTHEPLLAEDSEAVETVRQLLEERAEEYESLVTGTQVVTTDTPFARPAVSSSTAAVTSGSRRPSERIEQIDERDDRSSADVDGVQG